jgi:Polysaccharide pyruvyl transferase
VNACRFEHVKGPRSALIVVLRPSTTNIGNDLIALATDGLLSAAWPGPVDIVSLPSADVRRGAKSGGLTAANVYTANQLADAVIAGGGNVFENGALHVDRVVLAALRAPLAILAASTGRVRDRDGLLVRRTDSVPADDVAAVCALADPLLVRDAATAGYLSELGIGDVTVAGCPTLFLDRFVSDLPEPDPEFAGTALLSVRNPRLMSVPYAQRGRTHRDVGHLIGGLADAFDRVVLLCHDYQDLEFAYGFDGVEVRYTEDPRRLLSWLRGSAIAVGYRLHGFLAAVSLGVPAVHISYDERGRSMIETLGLEAHDVELHEAESVAGAVLDRVRALDGRPPRVDAEPALGRLETALTDGVRSLAARGSAEPVSAR